jgi:hypothetical protein
MNGNDASTVIPTLIGFRTVTFPPRGSNTVSRSVDVREMSWPSAMAFMRKLSEQVGLFTSAGQGGGTVFDIAKLKEAIPAAGELAELLVSRSTGLKSEELEDLSASEFLELLAVSMEINLAEELLGKFKRVAEVAARTFGAQKPNSPAPSTSS